MFLKHRIILCRGKPQAVTPPLPHPSPRTYRLLVKSAWTGWWYRLQSSRRQPMSGQPEQQPHPPGCRTLRQPLQPPAGAWKGGAPTSWARSGR